MNIFANWTAHQKNIATFVVALDCIWRARNKNIFENCPHNFEDICQDIKTRSNELIQVYNLQQTVQSDTDFNTSVSGIGWQRRVHSWFCEKHLSSWQNFLQYSTV